jgi:anti-sigma factor RsiW
MTSNFEGFDHERQINGNNSNTDNLPSNCFELLSAYIDNELTPSERDQVQGWLDQEPKIKNIYTRLLTLQGQMRNSQVPEGEKSATELSARIFQKIDRSRIHQRRLIWGGSAIAATFIAAISGIIPGIGSSSLEMADSSRSNLAISDSIMVAVAVNKPAVKIPKAAVGYSNQVKVSDN